MLYFTRLLNVLLFSVISINSYCQKDKNVISNPNFTDILLIGYERVEELSKLGYRINSINISNELDNSFKVSKYKLKYHRMIPNQDSIFVETIIISNQKVNPFEKNFKDFFKLTEYAIDVSTPKNRTV